MEIIILSNFNDGHQMDIWLESSINRWALDKIFKKVARFVIVFYSGISKPNILTGTWKQVEYKSWSLEAAL